MRVQAVVPAWMLGDGEYCGIEVGRVAEFGFLLESSSVEFRDTPRGVQQDGTMPPSTTVSATVRWSSPDMPLILDAGALRPIAPCADLVEDGQPVVVRGRLVVEPDLWGTGSVLRAAVPDGVRPWTVVDVRRRSGNGVEVLDALPAQIAVGHDSIYVLELETPSEASCSAAR